MVSYFTQSGEPELGKIDKLLSNLDCEVAHRTVSSVVDPRLKAGKWLLQHETYTSWRAGQSPTRLLWLKGIPGAGKTVLSSAVANDLRKIQMQDRQIAVAVFYCDHRDMFKRRSVHILASLLDQLLRMVPPDCCVLERVLDKYRHAQLHDIPLPIADLIMDVSCNFKRTFVVVDGLDICDNLDEMIPDLMRLSRCLHVFISSRDHPDIRYELEGMEKITIEQLDILDDIRAFTETETRRMKISFKLRESIIDRLVSGAQGTFLWPACYIKQLRQLRAESDIPKVLAGLPQGFGETVVRALETINDQPHSELLRALIQLVVCGVRPINPCALAHGIATLEMEDIWDPARVTNPTLVDDCATLLLCVPASRRAQYEHYWRDNGFDSEDWGYDISDDDDIVVPFHSSVKKYLLSNPTMLPSSLAKYSLHPPSSVHEDLARLCLKHLNLLKLSKDHDRIPSNRPFATYALLAWPFHVHASGKDSTAFDEFFVPWRTIKSKRWIPNPAHIAVRLNLPVNRGLSETMLAAEDDNGLSPLQFAIKHSTSPAVIDCLVVKSDLNQVSGDRQAATALHLSAMHRPEIIHQLLEHGADVKTRANGGLTPLHLLLEWNSPERALPCVSPLLLNGADVNAQDEMLRTPLHVLVRHAHSDSLERIVKCLLSHGANVNSSDKEGRTPLHLATQDGHAPIVASLLGNGATVDATDNASDTPLALAVKATGSGAVTTHEAILQYLIRHGADINYQRGSSGATLLHDATRSGHGSIVSLLLEQGAKVDVADSVGQTLLHVVCAGGYTAKQDTTSYEAIGKQLFDYGANVNARDKWNRTPLDWARRRKTVRLFPFLLEGATFSAIFKSVEDKEYASYIKPLPPPPGTVQGYNVLLDEPRPTKIEDYLRKFEILFIIDDSGPMSGARWSETHDALIDIAEYAFKLDTDTVGMRFFNNNTHVQGLQGSTELESIFTTVTPTNGTPTGRTLKVVFDEHLKRIETAISHRNYSDIPPLDIIVLTDGMPSDSPADVIADAVRRLKVNQYHPNTMGVQFVQIGNEDRAGYELKKLVKGDNGSIVDTVPYRGIVTSEMLQRIVLGGIHPNVRAQLPLDYLAI